MLTSTLLLVILGFYVLGVARILTLITPKLSSIKEFLVKRKIHSKGLYVMSLIIFGLVILLIILFLLICIFVLIFIFYIILKAFWIDFASVSRRMLKILTRKMATGHSLS